MSTKSTGAIVNIRGINLKSYNVGLDEQLVPEDEREEDYYTLQRRENGNPIYYIIPNNGDYIDDAVIVGRINSKGDVREWYGIPPMIRKIVKKIETRQRKQLRQPRERSASEIAYELERQRKEDEEEEEAKRYDIERARIVELAKQEEQDYTIRSIQRLYDNDVEKYGTGMFGASFDLVAKTPQTTRRAVASGGGGGGDEPGNGSTIFGNIIPEEPEEFYMTKKEIRELREEEERRNDPISATFDDVLSDISRSFEQFEQSPPTAEQLNATVQAHMSDLEGYLEEQEYDPSRDRSYSRQFAEVRRLLKELSEMPTEEMDTSAIPENPRWETSNKVRKAMVVYDYDEPIEQDRNRDEEEDERRERLKRERLEKEAERLRQRKAMFAEQDKKMKQEEERRKKREEQSRASTSRASTSSVKTENLFDKAYNELAKRPRYRQLFKLVDTVRAIDRIKTDYLNQERSADRQELEDLKRVRTQLADLAQQYEEELPAEINDFIADKYVELNNYIERSFSIRLSRGRRMV